MCGRFVLDIDEEALLNRFHLKSQIEYHRSREIFPGTEIYYFNRERELKEAPWGIKVDFLNRPIINTRIEKIYDSKFFLEDFEHRRIIVPATGFYEWNKMDGSKDRYLITGNTSLVGMAALCDKSGAISLMTKASTGEMKNIHHRMPLILPREFEEEYLLSDAPKSVYKILEQLSPKLHLKNMERFQQLRMF